MNRSSTFNSKIPTCCGMISALLLLMFFVGAVAIYGFERTRIYGWDKTDLPRVVAQLRRFSNADNRAIVFFLGDSTIMPMGGGEPLPEKLEVILSNLSEKAGSENRIKVQGLYHPRFDMAHYYILASRLISSKPAAIVVPLNLATLSPTWLETSGGRSFSYLTGLLPCTELIAEPKLYESFFHVSFSTLLWYQLIFKTNLSEGFFVWRGLRMHLRDSIKRGGEWVMGFIGFMKEESRLGPEMEGIPIKKGPQYLENLQVGERTWSIKFARKIQELGIKNNVPILFYVSPVDKEELKSAQRDLHKKIEKLNRILQIEKLPFFNIWDLLEHGEFKNPIHYNDDGGWHVARALGVELKAILGTKKL